jgi:hypothetical protein
MKLRFILLLGLSLLTVSVLFAQDNALNPDAEPRYLTHTVGPRILPDPFLFTIIGGGGVDASSMGEECAGYVTSNPTVALNWTNGDGEATDLLRIFTYSDYNASIIVQLPDGTYQCSDDAHEHLLDAQVDILSPAEGRYVIWVGTSAVDQIFAGFLVLTEQEAVSPASLELARLVSRGLRPEVDDTVGMQEATMMGTDGPTPEAFSDAEELVFTRDISGGGEIGAHAIDFEDAICNGYYQEQPSYTFTLPEEIAPEVLRIFFTTSEDTAMIVRLPDGTFACNDDYQGEANLNPLIDIFSPPAGEYHIYVGGLAPGVVVSGQLSVTTSTDVQPEVLSSGQ